MKQQDAQSTGQHLHGKQVHLCFLRASVLLQMRALALGTPGE